MSPISPSLRLPDTEAARKSRDVALRLQDAGFTAYWAGGCVRDLLLGREPKDFDVATSADPAQVVALFPRTREIGRAFGVVLVIDPPDDIQVATFRRDLAYEDGRRPTGVVFAAEHEDAQRRDFTVNGMFADPRDGRVIDHVGGRADLAARVIRAIGDPAARFGEDYLRMLRAARFAATLEFAIDPATAAAIRVLAPRIAAISVERIQQEFTRILLEAPRPGAALRLLQDLGLLEVLFPEVAGLHGVEQPPEHHPEGDVLTHTVMMLDAMTERTPELAYAVLLHDIAKPATFERIVEQGRERIRFHGHAALGEEMARAFLTRLRMPNAFTDHVATCVGHHMQFMDVPNMKTSTLRRILGRPTFATERELHRLDCLCSHGDLSNLDVLDRAAAERAAETALPKPWITGHDLMALGIPAGPEVGRWHRRAYEAQLNGDAEDREALLAWLRREMGGGGDQPTSTRQPGPGG